MQSVSTHAPLAGSDGHLVVDRHSVALFQPTLPLRGATVVLGLDSRGLWFQPTLPLRGATRPLGFFARLPRFNPRSPCGERQAARSSSRPSSCRFNPRSPCGERPFAALLWRVTPRFNPRSPCGERPSCNPEGPRHFVFQPTLPLRGATEVAAPSLYPRSVSTHAPLAGSDVISPGSVVARQRFNPRSPCGERPLHLVNVALRAYHMHDVFHPNASSDELRPSETNQKAVRTSQGIPDSPQFAPPIIPTAYS